MSTRPATAAEEGTKLALCGGCPKVGSFWAASLCGGQSPSSSAETSTLSPVPRYPCCQESVRSWWRRRWELRWLTVENGGTPPFPRCIRPRLTLFSLFFFLLPPARRTIEYLRRIKLSSCCYVRRRIKCWAFQFNMMYSYKNQFFFFVTMKICKHNPRVYVE